MIVSHLLNENKTPKRINRNNTEIYFPYDKLFKIIINKHPQAFIDILGLGFQFKTFLNSEFFNITYNQIYGDIVMESTDNKIHLIEFQSTHLRNKDKRRFGNYQTTIHYKEEKEVIVHVVSLVGEMIEPISYGYEKEYQFTIHYTSLNCLKSTKTLNKIINKILNNHELSEKEIVYLELFPLMEKKDKRKEALKKGIKLVTEIETLDMDQLAEIKSIYAILSVTLFNPKEIKVMEKVMNMITMDRLKFEGMDLYFDMKHRFKYEISRRRELKKAEENAKYEGKEEGIEERNYEIAKSMIKDNKYTIAEIVKLSKLDESIINQLIREVSEK